MFALSCSNFHMQIGYRCMIGNFSCVHISDVDTSLFMWQARQFNAQPEKTFTSLFTVSAKSYCRSLYRQMKNVCGFYDFV